MTADEVREKYIKFFEKRGHKRISPAPLVPENNSTLFTPFGMQQLVPYLMGKKHPKGTRLVNSQPSIRLDDIEEVGDNRHTTFFEMLGNWSLGDYFKKDQLRWLFKFLTDKKEGLGLEPNRLYVTVFGGDENFRVHKDGKYQKLTPDVESIALWKEIFKEVGINAKEGERIRAYPAEKNWWSASGTPKQMPVGEIGGPDSEIFYEFAQVKHNPKFGKECHTNCDCGRFLEIGNSVFMQYKKIDETTFEELPNKNVDFGGGLERMVAATNNEPDIFRIDIFNPMIKKLEKYFDIKYGDEKEMDEMYRIIADHIRASVFLVNSGVRPDNKLQGYVLRRLLRRAVTKTFLRNKDFIDSKKFKSLVRIVFKKHRVLFGGVDQEKVEWEIGHEIRRFRKTVEKGLKEFDKTPPVTYNSEGISYNDPGLKYDEKRPYLSAKLAFKLYETYGFPLDVSIEEAKSRDIAVPKNIYKLFQKEKGKHQELSRTASAGMFKGGLADKSEEVTKLHTITHLLHTSLRKILGEHVQQKGSNITAERLRFDFSHPQKLTDEEIKKVEKMINEQIKKDLPVTFETKTFKEAKKEGALAFFEGKYGEKVKVYSIGSFSREVCGGPHVSSTGKIGRVRMKKQEKIGAGLLRVYAVID